MKLIKSFINDEAGQGLTEYGLVLAGVVVIVAAAVLALTQGMGDLFTDIKAKLTDAIATVEP